MDEVLEHLIHSRLDSDEKVSDRTRAVVIAACRGEEHLAAALEDSTAEPMDEVRTAAVSGGNPAYLLDITVQGFRGIGPRASLEITPGPGLTLVVGRNGSGKSSFAEALELLLTGNNSRWSTRSAIWREGWRNLHQRDSRIEATLVVEGHKDKTRITREWDSDAKLEEGRTSVQVGSETTDLDSLGWVGAVEMYRPFLSYSELGSMLDAGPSALYDALSSILGLEELRNAEERVKERIKSGKKLADETKSELVPIIERLGEIDDERAATCVAALQEKIWDLDTVEKAVLGAISGEQEESELAALRSLAVLEPPAAEDVQAAAEGLDMAASSLKELGGTEAEKARQTVGLLEAALEFHKDHGDQDCPVCGAGSLDKSWRDQMEKEVVRLKALAENAELAHKLRDAAVKATQALLVPVPTVLAQASGLGLDSESLITAWKVWSEGVSVEDAESLAEHIRTSYQPLRDAVEAVGTGASRELQRREDVWRPVAGDLAAWLEKARESQAGAEQAEVLKQAEKWLRGASTDIRNERFAPIADLAHGVWESLRMQSSVELKKIVLAGAGTARKVVLDVTVDGMDGAALGVMSQGELNSLALSLFMPRATLPESPFRFIVIDDPVQSMDPSRVDGLARVLEKAAESRQVIVFTHDDRLPRSCRLLGIDAKVIEVTRRANSEVELRAGLDPVSRHAADAWAVAKSEDLDPAVASRIVGVFCRSAIEAACTEVITRKQLAQGETYEEIESVLDSAKGLAQLMSLALFNDIARTKDVAPTLERGIGKWASVAYRRVQDAVHKPVNQEEMITLVKESEQLARGLVKLP